MNLLDQCDARYSNSLLLDPHDVLNSQSRLTAFGEPPATPEMYTRLPHDINPSHGHGYPRIRVNTSALPSPAILPVDLYSTQCLPSSPLLDSTGGGYGSFPLTPSTASSTSPLRNTLEVPQRAPISPSLLSHSFWSQGSTQMPMPPSPYLPTPAYSPSEQPLLTFGDGTMVPGLPHHPIHTVLDLARQFPFTGVILPQRTYRPHTQSDRRRYVEEVELEEPIMFIMGSPDACGISCRDALNSKFMRLMGRDDQMFVNRGPSVSIRLCWPGYAPWSRQIPTRDFRTPPGPITRSKLAKNVAKTVFRFIEVSFNLTCALNDH